MEYRPIRSRWIVLGLAIVVVLSALCSGAAGQNLTSPRILWDIPLLVLNPMGIGLAAILAVRWRRWRQRRRDAGQAESDIH